MAILKSKQLSTRLSGSYVISGSTQNLIGQTTIEGQTTISGSAILKGPSVDLNIRQNDNTNLVRLLTTTGGTSALQLYDNFNHGSVLKTVEINTSDQNALIISSGSATILNLDRDNKKLFVDGNISGSSSFTGSFGSVETSGDLNSSGRIFEQGTSVIDHATAMAIVFGG
jgi:hypothetical protein|tara:strand:- start:170 stop:679 length:510 start_codon:yes stop_codon:yes gene_type:complete